VLPFSRRAAGSLISAVSIADEFFVVHECVDGEAGRRNQQFFGEPPAGCDLSQFRKSKAFSSMSRDSSGNLTRALFWFEVIGLIEPTSGIKKIDFRKTG
jgi:hypothetical protein